MAYLIFANVCDRAQLALPYAEVAAQLMELTLLGYLVEGPQGYERIG